MKRTLAITTVLFLFSALFFVCVCPAGDERSLKGSWSGEMYVMGPGAGLDTGLCPVGTLLVISIGKGVSSHSGASDYFGALCWRQIGDTTMEGEGFAILTGANGDKLFTNAILTSYDVGNPTGTGSWVESETVTGGTGKFEGATGTSYSEGTWTLITPARFSWTGKTNGLIGY